MNFLTWIKSLRRTEGATAAAIRRELESLRQRRVLAVRQRDQLALDAVNNEASSQRWLHLDKTSLELERRIAVLAAALPLAEAREAEATREAETAARATLEKDYERKTAGVQTWLEEQLARLPTGADLTKARELRDSLKNDANLMRPWSKAVNVRRPLDPLHALETEMQWRISRIARSRWTGPHAITLDKKETGTNG